MHRNRNIEEDYNTRANLTCYDYRLQVRFTASGARGFLIEEEEATIAESPRGGIYEINQNSPQRVAGSLTEFRNLRVETIRINYTNSNLQPNIRDENVTFSTPNRPLFN
jgi:hypothetical protein